MKSQTFSQKTVTIIGLLVGVSLIIGILLGIFQDEFTGFSTAQANTFSKSAIGHRGLIELLKKVDIPVVISTFQSGTKAGHYGGVLIIAEPYINHKDHVHAKRLKKMCKQSNKKLIVLPKWQGISDPEKPRWLKQVVPILDKNLHTIMDAFNLTVTVIRSEDTLEWKQNIYGVAPFLKSPQLITANGLKPLIACERGILLGELENPLYSEGKTLILTDPDIFANYNIGNGNNALLALKIIEDLRQGTGGIVFDETLHGFEIRRSVWRSFFEYPLVLVSISLALLLLALIWLMVYRFGKPIPLVSQIKWGKGYLIENTAFLLTYNGHNQYILEHYFENTIRYLATFLDLHIGNALEETVTNLWDISKSRNLDFNPHAIAKRIKSLKGKGKRQQSECVLIAQQIFAWRKEMTYGI